MGSPAIKPGTWNIPEHPGTSSKINFGLAHATIWSVQIGQVTLCFFSWAEQLCLEMNAYGRTFHRGKSIEKYTYKYFEWRRNVSTEYYPGSVKVIESKYKVSGVTVSNVWKTLCQTGEKSLSPC